MTPPPCSSILSSATIYCGWCLLGLQAPLPWTEARCRFQDQSPGCLGRCLSLLSTLVGQARLGTFEPGQKGDTRLAWEGNGTIGKGLGKERDCGHG